MKKICTALILAFSLLTLISPISSAGAIPAPWPECGETTIYTSGEYSHANLTITYGTSDGKDAVTFKSFNGWKIYYYSITFPGYLMGAAFPDGVTSDTMKIVGSFSDIQSIRVNLKKDCSDAEQACKPTDLYVYTLLGNYPCNLVTSESPIPARFLNRDYTGPLCQLPDLDHNWNGDWVVSPVKDCNGYQVGGNHYDTRLPEFP